MKWIIFLAFLLFAGLVISELVKKGTKKIADEIDEVKEPVVLPSEISLTDSESKILADHTAKGLKKDSLPKPLQIKLTKMAVAGRG